MISKTFWKKSLRSQKLNPGQEADDLAGLVTDLETTQLIVLMFLFKESSQSAFNKSNLTRFKLYRVKYPEFNQAEMEAS